MSDPSSDVNEPMIKPYMKMPTITTTSENPRWSCAFNAGIGNEIEPVVPTDQYRQRRYCSEKFQSNDSFGGDQSSSPAVSAPMPQ